MPSLDICVVPFAHPDSVLLIGEVQGEYTRRYGSPDEGPIDAGEFDPPGGLFLVGYLDGEPVACGGWRAHDGGDADTAEVKRMYVRPSARRRGVSRLLLAELERTAAAAGHRRMALETGHRQPEAIALYRSAGYTEIPAFGYYACSPGSMYFGKSITQPYEENPDADLRAG